MEKDSGPKVGPRASLCLCCIPIRIPALPLDAASVCGRIDSKVHFVYYTDSPVHWQKARPPAVSVHTHVHISKCRRLCGWWLGPANRPVVLKLMATFLLSSNSQEQISII